MLFKFINKFRHLYTNYKITSLESELGILETNQPINKKYWPSCSASSDGVLITIMCGEFIGLSPGYPVSRPNLLESLAGVTFEAKINKKYRKVQNRCNQMNAAELYANNSLILSGVDNGRN